MILPGRTPAEVGRDVAFHDSTWPGGRWELGAGCPTRGVRRSETNHPHVRSRPVGCWPTRPSRPVADGDDGDASTVEDLEHDHHRGRRRRRLGDDDARPEEAAWADLEPATGGAALSAAPDLASRAREVLRRRRVDRLQDTIRDLQAGGGGPTTVDLHQYSVSVGGDTAPVGYCFVDTTQRLDTSGQPTGTPEVTSMRANAQLQLIDGTWKLSETTIGPEQCPGS